MRRAIACFLEKDPAPAMALLAVLAACNSLGYALPSEVFPHNPALYHYLVVLPITETQWGWALLFVAGLVLAAVTVQRLLFRLFVAFACLLVYMPFGLLLVAGSVWGHYVSGYALMCLVMGVWPGVAMIQWVSVHTNGGGHER